MFVEVIDVSSVTTVVNTDAIALVQLSYSYDAESQESVFDKAIITMKNSLVIYLDETNWGILRNNIIPQ